MFFAIFLAVVGLQLTFKVIAKSWLWYNVNLMYLLSYSLPLLIGPALYLFIRSRQNVPLKWIDVLHVLPFVLELTNTLFGELYNNYYLSRLIGWFLPMTTLYFISLYAYGIASWRLLNRSSDGRNLKEFLLLVISSETIIMITIILLLRYNQRFPDVRWLFIVLTFLIYWISYKLLTDPGMFSQQVETVHLKPEVVVKYAHSGLKSEEADRIESLLRDLIYKQRYFLDPSVTIETLAAGLKVPRHHLSRVINERFKKRFNDLANDWRLQEARSRLADPQHRKLTISTIAYDCGFSSVPSFNTMFRRKFQSTPTAYRQLHLGEMTA